MSTRNLKRSIILDKKLEPYFLDYAKYNYLLNFGLDEKLKIENISSDAEIIFGSQIANDRLNDKLIELYQVEISYQDCDHPINQAIITAVQKYVNKYTIKRIIERPTPLISILAMQQFMKGVGLDILKCNSCGNKQHEIEFSQLPENAKKSFKDIKDDATYMYCMKCDE